ncbi:hypothetical protein, partial [Plasmodium yoelii yoelii]
FKRLCRLCFK